VFSSIMEPRCGCLHRNDTDGRLCLDNGIICTSVHDGAGNSAILLRFAKPGYSALPDLAQYDDHGHSHCPGMRQIFVGSG
jgi:hypothetical protein